MATAIAPGSFDPLTNGHIDVFTRAASIFDHVTVGVLVNEKKQSLFSVDERIDMLNEQLAPFPNVSVDAFHGLLVDYCNQHNIPIIVKGLRALSDFDYELQMAQMNHRLSGVETLFVSTNPIYGYLSSSLVKEVAKYGGDISGLVPEAVADLMRDRLSQD